MTIKLSNSKGRKIKCEHCKQIIFFTENEVSTDKKENRFIICEECGMKIKLKRL